MVRKLEKKRFQWCWKVCLFMHKYDLKHDLIFMQVLKVDKGNTIKHKYVYLLDTVEVYIFVFGRNTVYKCSLLSALGTNKGKKHKCRAFRIINPAEESKVFQST